MRPYSDEDERNDAASEEESAPLLDTEDDQQAVPPSTSKRLSKAIWILTLLTLCFSILAAMLLVANKILTGAQESAGYGYPGYEFYWPTRAGSRAVGITASPSSLCTTS